MLEILPYQKLSKSDSILLLPEAMKRVAHNRTKLILLIGKPESGKTQILQELSDNHKTPVFSLGYEISKAILEGLSNDKILGFLREKLGSKKSIKFLDNLEVLFARSLDLNPLDILKLLARDQVILACLPGQVIDGNLIFAEASTPEYKSYSKYELKDIVLFELLGDRE